MTKFIILLCTSLIIYTFQFSAYAQSVSINNTGALPNNSAMLDVSSNTKGILIPRMTKTDKMNIVSPVAGLMVYQTSPDSLGFYYYTGTAWNWIPNTSGTDSTYWRTKGNTGLVDSTSFVGNVDNVPLNFRTNNQKVGRLDATRFNNYFGRGAGNDLGVGQTSFGDSAGAITNNNFPGIYIGFRAGTKNIGTNNSFAGAWAGENNTSGAQNAFFGTVAGQFNTTGFYNVFMGYGAGRNSKTSAGNTAIGQQALQDDSSGQLNVAVGYQAMLSTKNAFENTAVGSFALQNHKFNPWNTAFGEFALNQDTSGTSNAAFGTSALRYNFNGNNNTALGTNTLFNHKRNDNNTAVGYESMVSDTSGGLNTAMGWRSLRFNRSGSENTAMGVGAMENDTLGFGNTATGRFAMGFGSKGNYNAALGYQALMYADSSSNSVGLGVNAGFYNVRDNIVAIGNGALAFNSYLQTDLKLGVENTAVGFSSSYYTNTGSKNTSLGFRSLQGPGSFGAGGGANNYKRNTAIGDSAQVATFGNDNTGVGYLTLSKNNSGNQHTAVGSRSLANTTAGYPNTAVGYSSMDSSTTGGANTAVGSYSMLSNKIGSANVSIGNAALFSGKSGSYNVAVGNDALRLDSADFNTVIGYEAGYYNNRSSNVYVGAYAGIYNTITTTNLSEGIENTGIGYRSLQANGRGSKNTGVGFRALAMYLDYSYINSPVSDRNTAVGDSSQAFMYGSGNTSVGNATLSNVQSGSQNTAMGDSSMALALGVIQNDAYGFNSLKSLKYSNYGAGYYNTAIGGQAMEYDTTAYATVALGFRSLHNAKKVWESTALGVGSMEFGDSISSSVAVGRGALNNFGHSHENTAVGTWAMSNKVAGYYNTALGLLAMERDSSGLSNTGIGVSALRSNVASGENVAVGINAGYYVLGDINNNGRNTYVGPYAGQGQSGLSIGVQNTGIGYNSMLGNTTGNFNTALGDNSLNTNADGGFNVAIGNEAGSVNISGSNNTLVGHKSNLSSGFLSNASAFGSNSFVSQSNSLVLGSINGINGASADTKVGIGTTSPSARLHVRSGASGGTYSPGSQIILENNTNSYIQLSHPDANETGIISSNVSLGIRSAVMFGANNSMQLRTGGNINRFYIDNGGFTGINRTPTPATNVGTLQIQNIGISDDILGLYNSSSGNRWTYWISSGSFPNLYMYFNGVTRGNWGYNDGVYTSSSDLHLKKDIEPLGNILSSITKIHPYLFHYNDNSPKDPLSVGFMAQEVQPFFPEAVTEITNKDGSTNLGIKYQFMSVYAVKAIQEQQQIIDKQQKTIDDLVKRLEKLENK